MRKKDYYDEIFGDNIVFYFDDPDIIIKSTISTGATYSVELLTGSIELLDVENNIIPFTSNKNDKVHVSLYRDPEYERVELSKLGRLRGDANVDGEITVSDAILMSRICAEDRNAEVTDPGKKNADVDGKKGLTMDDVTIVLKFLAGLIKTI